MDYKAIINTYHPQTGLEAKTKAVMLEAIEKDGDFILNRHNELHHITVSGFIINKAQTKTLMVHHNIYNSWGWTGGHADEEANLLHVALKEAKEETGLLAITPLTGEPISLEIIPVHPHKKKHEWVNAHLHFNITYILVAEEEASLRIKPDENSAVAWLPLQQLEDYVTEQNMLIHYKELIRRLKDGTN